MSIQLRLTALGLLCLPLAFGLPQIQADELGNAVRAAVKVADPSVVRLQVIGGEPKIDGDKVTSLVTTGIVISADGEILTSQFALQGNPEAVLAVDITGRRTSVQVIATDHVRRLVLLKAREGEWTPVRSAAKDSVRVGQWSIALGRFYQPEFSSVSVGVVSALNRIHGMAIQSDAKISPVNYGGPLINLQGEVMGILVPLSPRGQGDASTGVEWYDSGIGFAIPMVEAIEIAERLRSGKDLKAGRLGVKLTTSGIFSSDIKIERAIPKGPADLGGMKKGDRLLSVNAVPIVRMSILEEAVARSYAGDSLGFEVQRGDEKLSLQVTLTADLPVPSIGYIGLMTVRTAEAQEAGDKKNADPIARLLDELPPGRLPNLIPDLPKPSATKAESKSDHVPLLVINDSPASTAGLPPQIELLSVNTTKTPDVAALREAIAEVQAGDKVKVEYRLPGNKDVQSAEIVTEVQPKKVTQLSNAVLSKLMIMERTADPSEAKDDQKKNGEQRSDTQRRELDLAERGRCILFSSASESAVRPGIVLLLSSESESEDVILQRWKPFLNSHKLIVAVPVNPEKSRLSAVDIPLVMTAIQGISAGSKADLRRVVVVGDREQARLAWQMVFGGPSPIRGIALTNGWIAASQLENADGSDQSVLTLESSANAQSQALLEQSRDALRKAAFWVAQPSIEDPTRTIADWSLLLRSF